VGFAIYAIAAIAVIGDVLFASCVAPRIS